MEEWEKWRVCEKCPHRLVSEGGVNYQLLTNGDSHRCHMVLSQPCKGAERDRELKGIVSTKGQRLIVDVGKEV